MDEEENVTRIYGEADDVSFDTPNCPRCLNRMEAAGKHLNAGVWRCAHCDFTFLG